MPACAANAPGFSHGSNVGRQPVQLSVGRGPAKAVALSPAVLAVGGHEPVSVRDQGPAQTGARRLSMAEIAVRTDFADRSHMCRWMQQVYGAAPTQLAARLR